MDMTELLELAALDRADDPMLDATDGAHPAWWRGHDHVVARMGAALTDARAEVARLRDAIEDAYRTLSLAPSMRTAAAVAEQLERLLHPERFVTAPATLDAGPRDADGREVDTGHGALHPQRGGV